MDNYEYITKPPTIKPSPIEKKSTNKEIKESFITMEGTGEGASLWTGIVSAVCTFLVVILLFANDIQMAKTKNIPTLNNAKFSLMFVIFAAGIYCLQYSIKKNLSKKVSDQNIRVTTFLNNIGITKNEVHLKESISVYSQGTRKPKGVRGWVSAILKFLLEFVTSGSFIAMLIYVFMCNGTHQPSGVPQIPVVYIIVLFVILFATATASYFMLTHQIYDSIDTNKLKKKVKESLENKVNTNCSSLSENDKTAIRKNIDNMIPIRKTSTINNIINIILLIITIAIIIYFLYHTDFKDEFFTDSSIATRSLENNQKIILKFFLLYAFGTIICNIIPLFSISKSMNETQYNQLEAIYRNITTENIDSRCPTEEVEPEAEESII
tara:strand:+ start:30976 stop:32115 length:1140 start_codon:yes stop_codon:yes gene_type:complete